MENRLVNPLEEARFMATEAIGGKRIHQASDFRAVAVEVLRVICTVAVVSGDLRR